MRSPPSAACAWSAYSGTVSAAGARAELVGWRLLGRGPDDYPGAVLDSLLERAGLGQGPRAWFAGR